MSENLPRILHLSLIARIHQGSGIFKQLVLERQAARALCIRWSAEVFAPHAPGIDGIDIPNRAPQWLEATNEQSLFSRTRMNAEL